MLNMGCVVRAASLKCVPVSVAKHERRAFIDSGGHRVDCKASHLMAKQSSGLHFSAQALLSTMCNVLSSTELVGAVGQLSSMFF